MLLEGEKTALIGKTCAGCGSQLFEWERGPKVAMCPTCGWA